MTMLEVTHSSAAALAFGAKSPGLLEFIKIKAGIFLISHVTAVTKRQGRC